MDWKELAVTASTVAVEAVAELFYTAGCSGVAIEDPNLLRDYIEAGNWDCHDFVLPEVSDLSMVVGYFPDDEFLSMRLTQLEKGLRELLDYFPDIFLRLKQEAVKDEDWATAWKAFFKPQKIGQRIVIKPTWEDYARSPRELVIELDPGMAFGTGSHATTALCIKALERVVQPGKLVYDLGTGSGVLAIAAALLGAEVKAVDIDPLAVRVARENVAVNELMEKVEVYQGNLADVLSSSADLVVANIIADVVIVLAADLERILKPGGVCLASGIITERQGDVEAEFRARGLEIERVDEQEGWVVIQARRDA